jgi:putative membrane protein insertion efficiency factor
LTRAVTRSLTQAPVQVIVALLTAYKRHLSPLLPRSCRFTPTCSEYARLALLQQGLFHGGALAAFRLARCQPFHPGGVDLP